MLAYCRRLSSCSCSLLSSKIVGLESRFFSIFFTLEYSISLTKSECSGILLVVDEASILSPFSLRWLSLNKAYWSSCPELFPKLGVFVSLDILLFLFFGVTVFVLDNLLLSIFLFKLLYEIYLDIVKFIDLFWL